MKHTKETKRKISLSMKGNGYSHSQETKAKISAALKGRIFSAEHRAKLSASQKNRLCPGNPGNLRVGGGREAGFEHSREAKDKMAVAKMKDRNPNWLGGTSLEPYSWDFTPELKEEVRRRDCYKCRLCGSPQAENCRALYVHHVDYDKSNSDPINLLSLCGSCHSRSNSNRDQWTKIFQEMAKCQILESISNSKCLPQ